MVYLPPQALELTWSRRNCMAFTMVWVWVNEEPVMGRLETIFKVVVAAAPPPPPQAARAMLAITSNESTANKRLDIFLLLRNICLVNSTSRRCGIQQTADNAFRVSLTSFWSGYSHIQRKPEKPIQLGFPWLYFKPLQ
jgi:hypothetical protein